LPPRVVVLTVLLVLYVVAMPTLGFLLCSGLFLIASISYLWKKPVWQSVLVSVVSLLVIHIVFRIVFQVILPRGTLIEMFFNG
ncbi:MAG: tripartite tricarboxylate transporter TctB family protein, partial [Granulosicoccus sp.]